MTSPPSTADCRRPEPMSRGPPGPPGMTGSRGQETAATHAPPAGPEAAAAERGSAFPRLSHERAGPPAIVHAAERLPAPSMSQKRRGFARAAGWDGSPSFPPALRPTEDPGRWGQDAGPRGWEGHAGCLPARPASPAMRRHLTLQRARGSRTRRPPTASSALLAETQPPRPRPQPTGAESDATAPESRLGRGGDHVPWFGRTVLESMLLEAL